MLAYRGRELLTAYRAKATLLAARRAPEWKATGEWQTVVVSCSASFVNISVNGVPVATFQIEDQAGEVFFDVKDGEVELRDVLIDELPTAIKTGDALKGDGFQMPQTLREVRP